MDIDAQTETSAAALHAVAGSQIWPAPEWVTKADDLGFPWVRVHWERAARVPGAWFDTAKADKVVALWPSVFKLTVKRFAGRPFRLNFWQECIVRLIIGWKTTVDVLDEVTGEATRIAVRLFQELRLWIARKNGKSEFLAALALLFWALEGEVRGQGFCFAHDEAQAREVFDKMGDMVGYSPALAADCVVRSKVLWIQKFKSPFRLLAGKAAGKHGRAPAVTVGDEMHEWRSRDLADTLRQGEGASLQPVRLYASTAGLKTQRTGHDLWEESQQILDGRIDDPHTLVVIFALPDDADWEDEKNWPLANPSLGLSPTIAALRLEYARAKGKPSKEAAFRRYHCNQWVEDIVRWLPIKKWDACVSGHEAWKNLAEKLAGRGCYGGLDISKNRDFTALVWWFPPEEDEVGPTLLPRFWLPAETIEQRVKEERLPLDKWRDDEALIEIPGAVIDQDFVIEQVERDVATFDVRQLGWDPWNAQKLYTDLVKRGMAEELLPEMRMGTRTLGSASSEFERLVFAGLLNHAAHPVLRWMARHCDIRFDENMNFVPAKKRSAQNIDGIVASIMAGALSIEADREGPSVYEDRGILEIEVV